MMSDILNVSAVLKAAQKEEERRKRAISVDREVELDYDLGNMMAIETVPLDIVSMKQNQEEYITSLTRDATQLLLNKIFELPVSKVDDVIVAQLPAPSTNIPREKPVPKEKAMTRWEKFALRKGIKKRKQSRLVYDDTHKTYLPRHGYDKANDTSKDWIIPLSDQANPFEDHFEKRSELKQKRIQKNEKQQRRNYEEANALSSGLKTGINDMKKSKLVDQLRKTKTSTASLGRFDKKLDQEPKLKNAGKRRQFDSAVLDHGVEKSRTLNVLNQILDKEGNLNVTKAVGKSIASTNAKRHSEKGVKKIGSKTARAGKKR